MVDSFTQVPPNSTGNKIKTEIDAVDGAHIQYVTLKQELMDALSSAIDTALKLSEQPVNITSASFKLLSEQVQGTDAGLITNTVIHGKTTAGGGSFVDVKVNPSGALSTDASGSEILFDASLLNDNGSLKASPDAPLMQRNVFSEAISGGINSEWEIRGSIGSGQTVNQTGGNLVITAGTTANATTILRRSAPVKNNINFLYKFLRSQAIINNIIHIMLADKVGDNLSFVINSSTSITITFPAGTNPFTSQNIGQFISVGNFSGVSGCILGRYAIASISGDTINLTVSGGWPSSGSGTLDAFGWNYIRSLINTATTGNLSFNTQRNGFSDTDTVFGANSSTSLGYIASMQVNNGFVSYSDRAPASTNATAWAYRGGRDYNIPDEDTALYPYIIIQNGTTAPASGTTLTFGFVQTEHYKPICVEISSIKNLTEARPLITKIIGGNLQSQGVLVTGIARGTSNSGGSPVYVATGYSTAPGVISSGRNVDLQATLIGALITKPYAIPESDWKYVPASGGNTVSTDVQVKAAAGAGLKNYITAIQLDNFAAADTEFTIKDGSTVIWRTKIKAGTARQIDFPTPLASTANTAINVQCGTAGEVYHNLQGYIAP